MIYDALVEGSFSVAVAASSVSGSTGFDLNPDFGNGQSPRKGGMPGAGADFAIRCRVSTSFAVANGTPILQVHAVLSTAGDPSASTLVTAGDYSVVGTNCAPTQNLSGVLTPGYQAADLTEDEEFYIKCNPWTQTMRRTLGGNVDGDDFRYLGLILNVVNYSAGVQDFSAGAIQGNVVIASDVSQQAVTAANVKGPIHFPSGVVHK